MCWRGSALCLDSNSSPFLDCVVYPYKKVNRFVREDAGMIIATLLIHAAMLGFMLFFVSVISPSALKALDMASASKFLRYAFPRIFAFGFVVATMATLTSFLAPPSPARLISLVSALFFLDSTPLCCPPPQTNPTRPVQSAWLCPHPF